VECDIGPRHRAIAGYRPPPWRRVGDGDGHVGGAALTAPCVGGGCGVTTGRT
jgi:hypothetical protein